jgi:hypothetical protein
MLVGSYVESPSCIITLLCNRVLFIRTNEYDDVNIVAYLLKARTVDAEKQPLLGNGRIQQ